MGAPEEGHIPEVDFVSHLFDRSEVLENLLLRLSTLAATGGEPFFSSTLESLLHEVRATHSDEVQYRRVLRRILYLYTGGMGSFGDVVLQAHGQFLPEHREFDALRSRLFEVARDQIGIGDIS